MKPTRRGKKERYEDWTIDFSKCKVEFSIIPIGPYKKAEYGTVFMNVNFPDGRWVAFQIVDAMQVPLFKKEKEATQ